MSHQTQDVLRTAIKDFAGNLRISQMELANLADVSQPLISGFVSGRLNLSTESAERIRKALLKLVRDRATAVAFFLSAAF